MFLSQSIFFSFNIKSLMRNASKSWAFLLLINLHLDEGMLSNSALALERDLLTLGLIF